MTNFEAVVKSKTDIVQKVDQFQINYLLSQKASTSKYSGIFDSDQIKFVYFQI